MNLKRRNIVWPILAVSIISLVFSGCSEAKKPDVIDKNDLATQYYGNNAAWYLDNIPFFECSDKTIEEVYYYRWKLYKAHIRKVGPPNHYVVTEFIDDVEWDREPYGTIIAAAGHQIYEGRWLKDNSYLDGYINYLYQQGGNDRKYSEAIADATFARYLVNADAAFVTSQLDSMAHIFDVWDDHFDKVKGLYYITPDRDATEYAIASLDASGGKDGWGGEAFRPTINSYMAANAFAISQIATLKGSQSLSNEYLQKAETLKTALYFLWSDTLSHFSDRYNADNQYVHCWDFIEGRELAGYVPWMYNLPENQPKYMEAWKHLTDTARLMGKYGLRTVEPSYRYYMKQYRINPDGSYDCQWNGPSWPYQTSQVLTAAANLLNSYTQDYIIPSDYLYLLRQYARQHYLPDGTLNLQENYNPDTGKPIVGLERSHHYLHSAFNDLIITGLCGLRPCQGDTLTILPLVDETISYFCLAGVNYHGHELTIVYDAEGEKYGLGKGLTVIVNGRKAQLKEEGAGKYQVVIGKPVVREHRELGGDNPALNIQRSGFPAPSASVNNTPDSLWKAIDGRIIYFPEVGNWWSTSGSNSTTNWYAIDFGNSREISSIKLSFFVDGRAYDLPDEISVGYENRDIWHPVEIKKQTPEKLIGNTENNISFDKINVRKIRINLKQGIRQLPVALVELECY